MQPVSSMLKNSLFAILVVFSTSSFAGGGATGGATELTQIMNNVELAIQSTESRSQTMTQLSQYATQLRQYMQETRNMQNLSPSVINQNLKSYQTQLDTATSLYDTYNNTNSDLVQLRTMYQDSGSVMGGLGLTPEQYIHNETLAAQRRNGVYADAFAQQKQVMNNVQQDYAKANDLAAQIPATVGVHESLSVTNSHLNLVSGQLSNLTQTIVDQQLRDNALKESQSKSNEQHNRIWTDQGAREAAALERALR